jgi:hypothetical protein
VNLKLYLEVLWRFLRAVMVAELMIFVVASLFWIFSSEKTGQRFSTALFWTGALAAAVGVLSVKGAREGTADFAYL